MASSSWPDPANNNLLTDLQYEQIVSPPPSGVIGTPSDTSFAYADSGGLYVKVRANKLARVRGHAYSSGGADIQANVAPNSSGNPRIDTLVLRYDRSTGKVTEAIRQGTPAAAGTQVPPALTQQTGSSGVYELPILDIDVANNASTIGPGNVRTREVYLGPDGALLRLSTTTRPTGVSLGQREILTDLDVTYRWNGVSWRMITPYRQSQTLSAAVPSVTFDKMPAGLKNLTLRVSARSDTPSLSTGLYVKINNDGAGAYYGVINQVLNASVSGANAANNGQAQVGVVAAASAGAQHYGETIVDVVGWSRTDRYLNFTSRSTAYPTTAGSWLWQSGWEYAVAGAYTSIVLAPGAGNFTVGSEFTLEAWD